ncbi:MAG: hypothetical protein K1Y36_18335 [Blastocatellia bacterium]|nr:hypothetical protein [Blastocatellia bacterium]
MKKNLFVTTVFTALVFALSACGSAPPAAPAAPAKPAPTTPAEPKKESPKPPANTKTIAIPKEKQVPVPTDWTTHYDEVKGYQFQLPSDAKTNNQTVDGVDIFFATLEKPSEVGVLVLAWKDKKLTKEDLLTAAKNVLKEMGETLETGSVTELNPDYSLAEGTTVDKDGKKSKVKVLVATDVTDNYILIAGTDEDKYKANEAIIDAIWGSFAMYSGGASGQS